MGKVEIIKITFLKIVQVLKVITIFSTISNVVAGK
jgi:hypothetical protein